MINQSSVPLEKQLEVLARNHFWTWSPSTNELLDRLPGATAAQHPATTVAALTTGDWQAIASDETFTAEIAAAYTALASLIAQAPDRPTIAYISAEFGISELVPQYSGGLGILAGDHLKAASDLNLELCGVGLFYQEGFFRQEMSGPDQTEKYDVCDAAGTGHVDTGVTVQVNVGGEDVTARVWRLDVGIVPLFVLDTNLPENSAAGRAITDRLYSGDREHRIRQELILGIGGLRALRALDLDPEVVHLNEGHAGFVLLELLEDEMRAGSTLAEAIVAVKARTVFTTHTPVPAGIDRFDRSLIEQYLGSWATRNKLPLTTLFELGASADDHDIPKPFNMAALALKHTGAANGVSKLHGEVSRDLFANVPGGSEIGSITNGVHARTWVAPDLAETFDAVLGRNWDRGDSDAWANVDAITHHQMRTTKTAGRTRMIDMISGAGQDASNLSADALTVGFARRFATYKRADLILREVDHLTAMLADDDRPIQFVFAGKAHPADVPGKALLRIIADFASSPQANGRFIFVPDYEMAVARAMYAGCDVWLNNPIRPREASGTSGEKATLNGGLQCSIADGWWAEMYDGENGWAIPTSDSSEAEVRDSEEGTAISELLRSEIIPLFYADGIASGSDAWLDKVRVNWRTLGPQVTAARMVADYRDQVYTPAASRFAAHRDA